MGGKISKLKESSAKKIETLLVLFSFFGLSVLRFRSKKVLTRFNRVCTVVISCGVCVSHWLVLFTGPPHPSH